MILVLGVAILEEKIGEAEKLAGEPLNRTEDTPEKPLPMIVTVAPADPDEGEKDPIVGGCRTVKLEALVPVPSEFVTLIEPVDAPAGTLV